MANDEKTNPNIKIELDGEILTWENNDDGVHRNRILETKKGRYTLAGDTLKFSHEPHNSVDYTDHAGDNSSVEFWVKSHYATTPLLAA